jgi:hypothetical protein
MLRHVLAAALLAATTALVYPGEATAQSARPGVDCSLLTPQQAQGLPCANAPRPAPAIVEALPPHVPTQLDADCRDLNPYAGGDPEKAAECARRPLPGSSTPAFIIGAVYAYGYSSQTAVVLGVTTARDGVQVVTFEWLPESLNEGVTAMRTPPAPGGASNWVYVGRPSPM